MYIRKYDAGIIEEFDSIDELREFDVKVQRMYGQQSTSGNFRETELSGRKNDADETSKIQWRSDRI